jgi:lipopolysaccharide transport system ATP-binding protein
VGRIELEQVSLTFRIRQQRLLTLKEYVVGQLFRRSRNPLFKVRALRNVSLRIDQGERVGIIGANGAGKSTLLKLLAGIYPPTRGRRQVQGRISSLFDLHLGFEMDASGWDNIAYRSYLQGATPGLVRAKRKAIAEFSELGDHLQLPVRYYSAGMLVRLAFSIDTAIDPEVLLIDEVLSVGDLAFQIKARGRIRELIRRAEVMVVVSHDLDSLRGLCEKALWLDQGRVVRAGPTEEVIAAYAGSIANGAKPDHPCAAA